MKDRAMERALTPFRRHFLAKADANPDLKFLDLWMDSLGWLWAKYAVLTLPGEYVKYKLGHNIALEARYGFMEATA